MRLRIIALGHRMPAWVAQGFSDYAKRLPHDFVLELVELKPEPRGRGRTVAQLLAAEAPRIAASCKGCRVVALDERGKSWSTREFAGHLQEWHDSGDDVAFVIGSADGLDPAWLAGAQVRLSLSAMTLPHGLVRVMLAEQIYRAASLASGHPYHRE